MQQNQSTSEASLHAIDYWQVIKNRYGIILMTLFLVFMTAAVITYVMPKRYQSNAVVQVKTSTPTLQAFEESRFTDTISQNFFLTEFEVIKSQLTLKLVVQQLGLVARWGVSEEDALNMLRGMVDTQNIRGTDLISISVRHTNQVDARDIAREVFEAYSKRREEKESMSIESALKELEKSMQEQSDIVEEKRKQRDTLLRRASSVPYDKMTGRGGNREEDSMRQSLAGQVQLLKSELAQIDSVIDSLSKLNADELIRYTANLEIASNELKQFYPMYQEEKRKLEFMKLDGLGDRHPTVIASTQALETLMKQLQASTVSFTESLKIKRSAKAKELEEQEKRLDQEKLSFKEDVAGQYELQNAQDAFNSAQTLLDQMRGKLQMLRINVKQPKNLIELHEEPVVSQVPVSPNVTLNLILGAAVGLIFGVGIAFFLEYLDTSVKTLEDVERYLQVPVLAVIPKDVGILHKQSGMSPDAEAYRILRTNIEFNRKNPEDNSLTVVSGGAGEGKSTTLVNLAYICAQGGYTTLMIDADLRRPRLHTFFDINNSVGLTNYLTTELMLEDVILQTPVDNLFFMPSGVLPADAAGILNSRRMSELIQDVKQRFDLILVDSPPILGVSDASVLASEVDLTIIVVQHRKLPRNMLLRVKQSVENVGGHVIGVVLNNVDVRSDSQYQYYTSYYTYYAPADSQVVAPTRSSNVAPSSSPSNVTKRDDEQLY